MNFQEKIDQIVAKFPVSSLKEARKLLSQNYRDKKSSTSVFSSEAQSLAYLVARFPATFAAVQYVIQKLLEKDPAFSCATLLDLGAGPGTATLACLEMMPQIQKAILLEKSREAVLLGKEIANPASYEWIAQDLNHVDAFPSSDLAIFSYSLGEIPNYTPILEKLFASSVKTIVIIEPGTPSGYQTILTARDLFLSKNAKIIAPCPHAKACPLTKNDWCHFSVRLERSKLHKQIKEGDLGFEDEKFSYLIVSKEPKEIPSYSRIIRHPVKASGHVRLRLCTHEGKSEEKIISKKHKELYRTARDAEWGDSLDL